MVRARLLVWLFLFSLAGGGSAGAGTFSTYTLSSTVVQPANNSATLTAAIDTELSSQFVLLSTTQLKVTAFFSNTAGVSGILDGAYFYDSTGLLGSISSVKTSNSSTFKYSYPTTPGHLPGASDYDVDAVGATKTKYGLTPGNTPNWLSIVVNLTRAVTDDDLLAFLANGALDIGYHVQAIAGGRSDSFIADASGLVAPGQGSSPGQTATPEPASLPLLAGALAGLALIRRNRARSGG